MYYIYASLIHSHTIIKCIDFQSASSSNNLPINIRFLENQSTKSSALRRQDKINTAEEVE